MAHSIWTGSVSFGLVNIPVGMYSATEEHTVRFHQFEAGTSDRVRNLRVNERSGKEVAYADIVKGYDLGGESVIVTKEELAAASPERSSTIEISDFVELSEINPIFYRSTYYLAPKGEAAVKPYRLLLQAMAKTNMAGVSLFVMRNKEYLCVVRADRDILVLETLYFADEIRDPIDVLGDLPDAKPSTPKELTMAVELVNALSGPWEPEAYQDTYAEEVKALIARKQKGEDVVVHAEVTKGAPIVDLMDALKQSVDRSRRESQDRIGIWRFRVQPVEGQEAHGGGQAGHLGPHLSSGCQGREASGGRQTGGREGPWTQGGSTRPGWDRPAEGVLSRLED